MRSKSIQIYILSAFILSIALAGAAFGQTGASKTQPVKVVNTDAEAMPVKIISLSNGRKAFQARIAVQPLGNGFQSALLQIPAGKRLVIENVSVITRSPAGMRMEVNYFTYIDSNNDGVGDIADITFHRVALVDQGLFGDMQIATANDKVLVFADELIGTGHHYVAVQARLNDTPPANSFSQAQFTFTGWVEDIPAQ